MLDTMQSSSIEYFASVKFLDKLSQVAGSVPKIMFVLAELEKHLDTADILITTPFHPAYMTKERLEKAKKLKLLITAGIGSDHIDLKAAAERGLTVAEVTGILCCV